ncbi:hypothetical protein O181_090283 [Austropuccinia psidii MF-1]|uniref:Uncharacterized protein n=1 Tax=Austropuccinia psidii MF-1 TaxID=1389203 RepID=A0A9Q3IUS9_9BASI|nr:hypothetical protein [Austropuccinia psidii MF-1]
MDAETLLANALSPDPTLWSNATNQLETVSREHFTPYLDSILSVLISIDQPSHIRNASGLAIKNARTSRELPEVLEAQSNEILNAVVSGARKVEPSSKFQIASLNALLNSLEFFHNSFDRKVS